MVKGWIGERQRHSVSRRGIRTTNNIKIRSCGKYNYWEQLYPFVMPYLKHFQRDFLEHDKKILENTNEFVMGIRDSGTDIFVLDYNPEKYERHTLEELLADTTWVSRGSNNLFFYGKDGKIVEITLKQAEKIMFDKVIKYDKKRKTHFSDFPSATDSQIFRDAQSEINQRLFYGIREERVEPKKFYTILMWSNAAEEWIPNKKHFITEKINLDSNEVLLPYKFEEVKQIINDLPPLPLYTYSTEYKERTLMTEKERKQLGIDWAKSMGEQFKDKSELL